MAMIVNMPTIRDFWKAIALFAWRRWVRPGERFPVGIPGNRDPSAPCASYEPIEWKAPTWNNCETDGHYLCVECCHISARARACRAEGDYDEFAEPETKE